MIIIHIQSKQQLLQKQYNIHQEHDCWYKFGVNHKIVNYLWCHICAFISYTIKSIIMMIRRRRMTVFTFHLINCGALYFHLSSANAAKVRAPSLSKSSDITTINASRYNDKSSFSPLYCTISEPFYPVKY